MDEDTSTTKEIDLLEITAHIVSAYVAKNRLPAADLGGLIASVASSIGGISQPAEPAAPPPVPAVNPRRSVTPDYIICLEDGKKKWRKYVFDVVDRLRAALQPDYVVIGGGNVDKLDELPEKSRRGDNTRAFEGGFRLWRDKALIV